MGEFSLENTHLDFYTTKEALAFLDDVYHTFYTIMFFRLFDIKPSIKDYEYLLQNRKDPSYLQAFRKKHQKK